MPRFSYSAYQTDGQVVSGTIDAVDEPHALEQISARGLVPVDLRLGSRKGPWWSREFSLTGASSVKPRDLEAFFESFATLLSAQMPLPRALAFCEEQARNFELAQSISELRADIENGKTLSAALEAQESVIPERLQALLQLGESSNTLPQAVSRAAEMLRVEAELRHEIKSAMIYPVILLVMSLLVLALIVLYLAPTLLPVFTTAGATPPFILQALNNIRDLVLADPIVSAIGAGAMCILTFLLRKPITKVASALLSRIPIITTYQSARETLRFTQTVTLMLTAGATLPEALKAAESAAVSKSWQAALARSREDIEAGGTLSGSLESFAEFDAMTLSLLKAGEESDNLIVMLTSAATKLQSTTQNALQQALRLLTPALTLIIGGMVGLLIISTISAILDLNDIAF